MSARWGVAFGPTRLRRGLILVAALLPWIAPERSQAQFEAGWLFGGYQTPASVNYLNDRSLARGAAAAAARPQTLQAPSRPPRDTTFFERYDPATRQAMESRVARRPSLASRRPATPLRPPATLTTPTRPAPATPPVPTRILASLVSFFDDKDRIVWPIDSPNEGELGRKRAASDAASLQVLNEVRAEGQSRVSTVTNARNLLVEYGRPALVEVRANAAGAADTFHAFLNALYDALGASAGGSAPSGSGRR